MTQKTGAIQALDGVRQSHDEGMGQESLGRYREIFDSALNLAKFQEKDFWYLARLVHFKRITTEQYAAIRVLTQIIADWIAEHGEEKRPRLQAMFQLAGNRDYQEKLSALDPSDQQSHTEISQFTSGLPTSIGKS